MRAGCNVGAAAFAAAPAEFTRGARVARISQDCYEVRLIQDGGALILTVPR